MSDVVILCEYPTLNGGERSTLALVDAIKSGGFHPVFAAPSKGELADELRRRNISQHQWNLVDAKGKRRTLQEIRDRLRESLATWKPDLVHANSLSTARIVGPVAWEMGLPSIGHLRDIVKLGRAAMEDLNRNTRLLAVSQATRSWHVNHGLSPDKTHVLYNGIDTNRFRPRASSGFLHRELRLDKQAQIALSIGQIGMRKGLDVTLQALRHIVDEFPNLHFAVVGQRNSEKREAVSYEQQLRATAHRAPLCGRVHFLGRRRDIARLLNEAALLIHAARQEPLGRVLLEAAAAGVPILASQVGGTAEIFPPATKSALTFPADDSDALSDAIRDVLRSDSLSVMLAHAARREIDQRFNARDAGPRLLTHYRQVLALEDSTGQFRK